MNFAKTRKFYPLLRLKIYHTKKGGWAFSGIPQFSLLLGLEMWTKFTERGSIKVEAISVCLCTHTPLCYHIYMLGRYAMLRIQGWCWIAVWILIIQDSLGVFHTAVDCNTQSCLIVCLRLKNLLFKCLLLLKIKSNHKDRCLQYNVNNKDHYQVYIRAPAQILEQGSAHSSVRNSEPLCLLSPDRSGF